MRKSRTPEDVETLSREERRRLRVGRRRVKGKPREKRRILSRDALLDYLRRNDIKAWRKLDAVRKPGDPTVWDYRKEFVRWSEARIAAFGKEAFPPEITAAYLVKIIVQFGLWSYRTYQEGRRMRPDIVPSMWHVRREFKYWSTCVYYANKSDSKRALEKYMRLKRRFGRLPTTAECHEHNVDIQKLLTLFGGKKYLYQNVQMMEKEHERRRRNIKQAR